MSAMTDVSEPGEVVRTAIPAVRRLRGRRIAVSLGPACVTE